MSVTHFSLLCRYPIGRKCLSKTYNLSHCSLRNVSTSRPVCSVMPDEKTLSYHHQTSTEPLVNWTYAQCLKRRSEQTPDRVMYTFMEENLELTYREFAERVTRCAQGLVACGLKKGDSLLIFCPNTHNWLVIFTACATLGILSASVHPAYTKKELFNALDKVKPKAIFMPENFKTIDFYANLCKWIPEIGSAAPGQLNSERHPYLRTVIVDSEKSLPGTLNMNSEIMAGGTANIDDLTRQVGPDDPFTVIFTSGTTGAAKAALLVQHGLLNNSYVSNKKLTTGEHECILNPLPLFHVFGLMSSATALTCGFQIVFPSIGYDQVSLLKAIQRYKCTRMMGSPTMYIDLFNHPEFGKYDLSSMRSYIMGGSNCSEEVRRMVMKAGGTAPVGYGATETSTVCTLTSDTDPLEKRMTTVGRPLDHLEIKIANPDTGLEVPVGEPGEVWIRGFNIFNGYLGEENKTREVITSSRWYKSGDVGTMDADGYISIVGRVKDLIIRGGENIHPIDIESELDLHPAVEESHVVAVPDKRLGEEICAVVVLKDGSKATEEELKDYLKGKLAYFKVPKYFVFEYDIPKTAIGKAQKNKLRETAAKKLGLLEF